MTSQWLIYALKAQKNVTEKKSVDLLKKPSMGGEDFAST
jgi:hypothetical protein